MSNSKPAVALVVAFCTEHVSRQRDTVLMNVMLGAITCRRCSWKKYHEQPDEDIGWYKSSHREKLTVDLP